MKWIILLLLSAQTLAVTVNYAPFSSHFGRIATACGYSFNEKIDLVAIEYKGYTVSTFYNSYYRQSFTFAKRFSRDVGKINFSAQLGGVYGYNKMMQTDCMGIKEKSEILPFIAFGARIPIVDKFGLELVTTGLASTLSIYYKF